MVKERTKTKVTPKQNRFCEAYTALGEKTYSNGTKSAIEAGYSEHTACSQAHRLLIKPHIQQRLENIRTEMLDMAGITVNKILYDLEHDKRASRDDGQYSVATRCTELQGKHLSMFADRVQVDIEVQRKYTETERLEARRLAGLLIDKSMEALPDSVPVDILDVVPEAVESVVEEVVDKPARDTYSETSAVTDDPHVSNDTEDRQSAVDVEPAPDKQEPACEDGQDKEDKEDKPVTWEDIKGNDSRKDREAYKRRLEMFLSMVTPGGISDYKKEDDIPAEETPKPP